MRDALPSLIALAVAGCLDLGTAPWESPDAASGHPGGGPPRGAGGGGAVPLDDGGLPVPLGDAGDDALHCPHPDGPQEARVFMVTNAFQPNAIEICAGDTVTWENRDTKEHTVYTGTPEAPDGLIASQKIYFGETFSYRFDVPGEYLYYCTTHKKKMRDALVSVR